MLSEVSRAPSGTIILAGSHAWQLGTASDMAEASSIILVCPEELKDAAAEYFQDYEGNLTWCNGVLGSSSKIERLYIFSDGQLNGVKPPSGAMDKWLPKANYLRSADVQVFSVREMLGTQACLSLPIKVFIDSPGSEIEIIQGLSEASLFGEIANLRIRCYVEALFEGGASSAGIEISVISMGMTLLQSDKSDELRAVLVFRNQLYHDNMIGQASAQGLGTRWQGIEVVYDANAAQSDILDTARQFDKLAKDLSHLQRQYAEESNRLMADFDVEMNQSISLSKNLEYIRYRQASSVLINSENQMSAAEPRRVVRMLHHFACTGGTVLSKCIAALPNVMLLSEIDPLSTMLFDPDNPPFQPTDLLIATRYADRSKDPDILLDLFKGSLCALSDSVERRGISLVLRDHNHSHFCMGIDPKSRPTLREALPSGTRALSAVTVRNPIDSYLSLHDLGWDTNMTPTTIDEYAKRYIQFIERHAGYPIFRYEDFIANPRNELTKLCQKLELEFHESALTSFSSIRLSGDSGRGSDVLAPRARRPIPDNIRQQISHSKSLDQLCAMLGYQDS